MKESFERSSYLLKVSQTELDLSTGMLTLFPAAGCSVYVKRKPEALTFLLRERSQLSRHLEERQD